MKQLIQALFKRKSVGIGTAQAITVVSGLPRSGTSMVMKMLEAGGVPVLTDNLRKADTDNPKGYYEFERVKQLNKGDHEWLKDAHGKAVKVISALLEHLPPNYYYNVLFVHRQIEEILASQKKMLVHRGEPTDKVRDEELKVYFEKHKSKVVTWLHTQPNISVLDIDYNHLVGDPEPYLRQINHFLDDALDLEQMASVVDLNLYRNRTK